MRRTTRPDDHAQIEHQPDDPPDSAPESVEHPGDFDDTSDLDEPESTSSDDDRWDVFLLDDDPDPLPDYGDFWLPD